MDPLDFPNWSISPSEVPVAPPPKPPVDITVAIDPTEVTIRIIGDASRVAAQSVPHTDDPLSSYLSELGLKRYAIYRAVYDLTNLEKGRIRMWYVPEPGAVIIIAPPSFRPSSLVLQRAPRPAPPSSSTRPAPLVEEVSLRYTQPKVASSGSLSKQPAEQI